MMLRMLLLAAIGTAAAAPLAAQSPEALTCTLGKATVLATVDRSEGIVRLSNARNSKTQSLPARFAGDAVNFSDGEDPVALLYTINRQSMRIDRWISDGSEGRTHLDDGKCRSATIELAASAPIEPFKAP
jgi:hypothetical protein